MKTIIRTVGAAALLFGAAMPADAAPTCLRAFQIDHTSVPDARTILFHMKDGKVWHNTLATACPSLKFDGYVMEFRGVDEICANEMVVRVLGSHEVCALGAFTAEQPRARPGQRAFQD